jgi:microcin C transport system substrate-binding protein
MQLPPRENSVIDRRSVLLLGSSAAAALLARSAVAQTRVAEPRHGMSVFGDLKYPASFKNFDYVDPRAPKGGRFSYSPSSWAFNQNPNTFNTLNTLIIKGDAPVGLTIIFASLMVRALDEPDAVYGLVAESVTVEEENILYRFKLRPEARFHDGTPITSEDIAFSIETLKKDGHPSLSQPLRDVVAVEPAGPHDVAIRFTGKQPRDMPVTVAGLPILSKAFYTANPFNESTMTPPLGSGPYKVGTLAAGRFIEYERIKDWWGNDLAVSAGQNNFDILRVEFFRDRQIAIEGFKGGAYWYREEFTSRHWATAYDFPAVRENRVVRFELPDERASAAQGWWINTRRKKFQDRRVREALDLAFDFEWTNAKLMYDSYKRTHSIFEGSDMKAEGLPSPEELALLEPYRGRVPDEVFGEPYIPPVSDGSGKDRKLLLHAQQLLREAGLKREGNILLDNEGKPFEIEFLDDDPIFTPHVLAYVQNLEFLGIKATQRIVDAAQFNLRETEFDFDIIPRRFAFNSTPGESLRRYFGSEAADIKGSVNISGVKDPVIDALIDKAVNADTRQNLNTAARALDRVIRAGRYWVPHWYKGTHWLATWDVFGRPETKPRYGLPSETAWWFDAEKAARIGIKL